MKLSLRYEVEFYAIRIVWPATLFQQAGGAIISESKKRSRVAKLKRIRGDMKALLVYPEFPDTYWSFRHALKFEGKRVAFPPLGLMTIAAMMPGTWERRLVDMNVEELWPEDIEWADIVFISAMIVQNESLEKVVALCRSLGKTTVVGGPYVSTSSQRLGIHRNL